jgi:hypothetical protein
MTQKYTKKTTTISADPMPVHSDKHILFMIDFQSIKSTSQEKILEIIEINEIESDGNKYDGNQPVKPYLEQLDFVIKISDSRNAEGQKVSNYNNRETGCNRKDHRQIQA